MHLDECVAQVQRLVDKLGDWLYVTREDDTILIKTQKQRFIFRFQQSRTMVVDVMGEIINRNKGRWDVFYVPALDILLRVLPHPNRPFEFEKVNDFFVCTLYGDFKYITEYKEKHILSLMELVQKTQTQQQRMAESPSKRSRVEDVAEAALAAADAELAQFPHAREAQEEKEPDPVDVDDARANRILGLRASADSISFETECEDGKTTSEQLELIAEDMDRFQKLHTKTLKGKGTLEFDPATIASKARELAQLMKAYEDLAKRFFTEKVNDFTEEERVAFGF
jgi:hypothetical protein